MFDAIKIGARLAFSEYPGAKQLRDLELKARKEIRSKFLEALSEIAGIDEKKRIRQAQRDARHFSDAVVGRIIIVDGDSIVHRQNGYSYTRWKREIEPVVGSGHDATSVCGVHGKMRGTTTCDIELRWCQKCWPKVSELVEKYRP